jgi:cob(I)alamin adenosyltransferase
MDMPFGITWSGRQRKSSNEKHPCDIRPVFWFINHYFVYPNLSNALQFGWLNTQEVLAWLKENKPPKLHLLVTGRDAPGKLIDMADLVTEMKSIRHPYENGVTAQPGIEF